MSIDEKETELQPTLTGNKGEWSELYTLIYLLSTGRLESADDNLECIEGAYFPILKILRDDEKNNRHVSFSIAPEEKIVQVYFNGVLKNELSQQHLGTKAEELLEHIKHGSRDGAFPIEGTRELLSSLCCKKIKAPSTDKADIHLYIHDYHNGMNIRSGFSIKSQLGQPSLLFNASPATNFRYEIQGKLGPLNDAVMNTINAVETRTKIQDRINMLQSAGFYFVFDEPENLNFKTNLMLIDSCLDKILAEIVRISFTTGEMRLLKLVELLEQVNPLNYPKPEVFYRYKIRKFLCAVALGMKPSKEWDGAEEANGGYIIVKRDGDIVAFHIYNREFFENYLLKNTKLERGSTTRHNFGMIYKNSDRYYINFNLQIRFRH